MEVKNKHKAAAAKRPQTFKPGQSGNPNGRPKKSQCVSSLLRELLEGDPQQLGVKWKDNSATGAMVVAFALYSKMAKGDLTAIKEGLDRAEGKVPTPMAISGDDNGMPIKIIYAPVKEEKE